MAMAGQPEERGTRQERTLSCLSERFECHVGAGVHLIGAVASTPRKVRHFSTCVMETFRFSPGHFLLEHSPRICL